MSQSGSAELVHVALDLSQLGFVGLLVPPAPTPPSLVVLPPAFALPPALAIVPPPEPPLLWLEPPVLPLPAWLELPPPPPLVWLESPLFSLEPQVAWLEPPLPWLEPPDDSVVDVEPLEPAFPFESPPLEFDDEHWTNAIISPMGRTGIVVRERFRTVRLRLVPVDKTTHT